MTWLPVTAAFVSTWTASPAVSKPSTKPVPVKPGWFVFVVVPVLLPNSAS